MSLQRRGKTEEWEILPVAGRARALSRATLPTGRIALLAAALLMAYLVLSGTAPSGAVNLNTGDASPAPSPPPPRLAAPPSPATDLTVAKTDLPDPVTIDGVLAYTVTVKNIGAITAEDVFVADTLPRPVPLISSTPSQGSCDGIMCSLGSIAAGESAVISYVALVTEGAEGPIVNVVCAMTRTLETNLANNCADEETNLKVPLAATSTPNGIPVMGGGPINGAGAPGPSLLLLIGAALAFTGGAACIAARRRAPNS